MKNVGQERFLIVVILLLVFLAGLSDVTAFAADRNQQVKVGKEGDITFQVETRVGAFTLKPGRYFIRHRVAGEEHFIQFTKVSKQNGKFSGGFPVSPPLELKVHETIIIYANSEAGVRQIETVLVSGENVAHSFWVAQLRRAEPREALVSVVTSFCDAYRSHLLLCRVASGISLS